jgi:anti-sigma factor RsiW
MRHLSACEQVTAWLSDYLDEDLDTGTAAEVEKHLRVCVRCLALADSLRRTIEVCHAYEPSVKPQPLHPSARAELERAWQKTLAARPIGPNRGT